MTKSVKKHTANEYEIFYCASAHRKIFLLGASDRPTILSNVEGQIKQQEKALGHRLCKDGECDVFHALRDKHNR